MKIHNPTPTQICCIIASVVMIGIGCMKQHDYRIGHFVPVSPYVRQLDSCMALDVQRRGTPKDSVVMDLDK